MPENNSETALRIGLRRSGQGPKCPIFGKSNAKKGLLRVGFEPQPDLGRLGIFGLEVEHFHVLLVG